MQSPFNDVLFFARRDMARPFGLINGTENPLDQLPSTFVSDTRHDDVDDDTYMHIMYYYVMTTTKLR